jgi:hypothetical protein
MSRGWYPRRRGILEHLNNGRISLLDAAVHDFLCLICTYATGVAFASAEKIRALCPRGTSLRAVQRSLEHLEEIGWIKRFRTHGARGNYPILIGKYFVIDASQKWYSVNLEKTSDWRDVQFDIVTDELFSRHRTVPERGTELSSLKELKSETKNKKEINGVLDRPSEDTRSAPSRNFRKSSPFPAKNIAHPILPNWELHPDMRLFATNRGILDVDDTFAAFKDHHLARGSLFKDWRAAWRNWVRNAKKFDRGQHGNKNQPESFAERNVRRAQEGLSEIRRRAQSVLGEVESRVSESSDRDRMPASVPRGLIGPHGVTN